jgi:tetratricopeptide (TPR) repeat protein
LLGLAAVAALAAGHYHRVQLERAAAFFKSGQTLVAQGSRDRALERFRAALQLSPENRDYGLALAEDLTHLGRLAEGEARLADILQHDPTDAIANLMMARIRARQGQTDDAVLSYHRAIYGLWPIDPGVNRLTVRFELIAFLQRLGRRKQLVGELQLVRGELPDEPSSKKRAATLFLAVGMPREAAELYREVARRAGRDGELYARLGEAEYLAGNYGPAETALRRAVALSPGNEALRSRLDATRDILNLDPSERRLAQSERSRRARELLRRSLAALEKCPPAQPAPLVAEALRALRPARIQRDTVIRDIELAEHLWSARGDACPGGAEEEVLGRVFGRLSQ